MTVARRAVSAALAAALVLGFCRSVSAEELTPEAVAQHVAERFGVEVLDVADGNEDGRRVYIVTVMNPGGNSNTAFQVNRLMVDRATGKLVSQFRHEAAGYQLPGAGSASAGTDGRAIRRMSLEGQSDRASE